ncbi:hypothetical protein A3K86_03850 [Photobacterium jeanii]|uniref:Cadherin-like domain-containing protein n=1 Tax=Photobacterium jeanii TaxID=858640 RepID=A0A178KLD7_9GAMM|nr:tandem-95 repeat protein [Photobacterium jeanii]OAN18060.1 hypothetical protein A3K86_03850 [Photobacterium jeanii]PST92268.1 tandem-95 repeat protein [Photobacterium jeanii]
MAGKKHQDGSHSQDNELNDAVEHAATPDESTDEHRAQDRQNQQSTMSSTTATGAEASEQHDQANPQAGGEKRAQDDELEGDAGAGGAKQAQDEPSGRQGRRQQESEQQASAAEEPKSPQGDVGVQSVGGDSPRGGGRQDGERQEARDGGEAQASAGGAASGAGSRGGAQRQQAEQQEFDTATTSETFQVDVADAGAAARSLEDDFDTETVSETFQVQVDNVNDEVEIDADKPISFDGVEDNVIVITEAELLANASDVDGDDLVVTNLSVENAKVETKTDQETGEVSYVITPEPNVNGELAIKFDVSDQHGSEVASGATLTLEAVNDAAVVTDTELVGKEDISITFTQDMLLQNATDVDSDNLTAINLSIDDKYGELVDNKDGSFTFTPTQDYNGDVPFKFEVDDGDGAITPAQGTLDLAAVNDAPVLAETSYKVNEDGSILIEKSSLLANASDVDQDDIELVKIESDDNGTVVEQPNGDWLYTPNPDYSGDANLKITLNDGTVDAVFDAPVTVVPDADEPMLNLALTNMSLVDFGVGHDSALQGWHTDNARDFIEMHPDYVYGVGDDRGKVIELEANRGDESNLYSDLDVKAGDIVEVNFDMSARRGFEGEDSQIDIYFEGELVDSLISHQAGWDSYSYQFTATKDNPRIEFDSPDDNSLGGLLDKIQITKAIPEDQPVPLHIDAAVTDLDSSESLQSLVVDNLPDGAVLTDGDNVFYAEGDKDSVDINGWDLSQLSFQGAENFNGPVELKVTATSQEDATAGSETATTSAEINFEVVPINDPVVIDEKSPLEFTTEEDTPILITEAALLKNASDVDGDNLIVTNFSIDNATFQTIIDPDTGDKSFLVTPAQDFHGELDISFNVSDQSGSIVASDAELTVTPVNDPVIAEDDSELKGADPLIRLDADPEHGSVQCLNKDGEWEDMQVGVEYPADTQVQYVPDTEDVQAGTRDIKVGSFDSDTSTKVFDGRAKVEDWGEVDGNTAVYEEGGVTITTQVNVGELGAWNGAGSHVGAGIGNTTRHGLDTKETLTVTVEGEDVNQITFQLDGLGGYFDETSRNATEVIIKAYDADGNLIDSQGGYRESGEYQDTYAFTTDVPVHHFTLGTTGSNGTYVVQNMTVSRTMADEIQMTTIQPDGSEVANVAKLDLNHSKADEAVDVTEQLVEVDDSITTRAIEVEEDGQLIIDPADLLKNDTDIDGDILTITGVEATDDTHGKVELDEDGNVVFIPDPDYKGPASFTYTVSDGMGSSDTATVSVQVTPVNDDPIAPTLEMNVDEDQVLVIDPAYILKQASDVDSDQLTLESLVLKQPQAGQLQQQPDGMYHLITPPDFNGLIELDYQISDGTELVDGGMKVDVLPVNDAPFNGGNAHLTTHEDGAFTFNADDMLDLFGDVDGDGDQLVVSRVITVEGEEAGNVEQNEDGSWTFTPNKDYSGTAELQVEVKDPDGLTAVLDVPVYIRPVADGAVITTDAQGPIVFDEDTTGLLGLNVEMLDASEQLSHLVITGFPVGFEVSDGQNTVTITEPGQVIDVTEWSFNDLSMTPPQDFHGSFSVTVSATTADYGEESSNELADATQAYSDFDTGAGETLVLTLDDLLDMADIDAAEGDQVQSVHLIDRSQGEMTDNGDGTWSFTPADGFNGHVDFAYQVHHDGEWHDTQSAIHVSEEAGAEAVNTPPTVDSIVTTELGAGNTLTFTDADMLAQVSDADGNELSIESVQLISGQGVLETNAEGEYSFVPAEGYSGEAQIAFVATDGEASIRSHFNVDIASPEPSTESQPDFMLSEMGALELSPQDILSELGLSDEHSVTSVDYHGEQGTLIEDDGQWVFWSDEDFAGQLDLEVSTADSGDGGTAVHQLSLDVADYQDPEAQPQAKGEEPESQGAQQQAFDTQTQQDDPESSEESEQGADITAAPGSDVRIDIPDAIAENSDVDQVDISNLPAGSSLSSGIDNQDGSFTISGDLDAPITLTLPEGFEGSADISFVGKDDMGAEVEGAAETLTLDVDDEYAMQSGKSAQEGQPMPEESGQGDWTQGDERDQGVDVMDDSSSYDSDDGMSQQGDQSAVDESFQP